MSTSDDEIQRFREAFSQRSQLIDTSHCPPSEAIFDATNGWLSPSEVSSLVDHVSKCASCGESWRLAQAIEPKPEKGRRPRHRALIGLATAATLVLSASVFVVTYEHQNPEPSYRGSEQLVSISNTTPDVLPSDNFTLRWESAKTWQSYSVHLMNSDLETIWTTSGISSRSVRVPMQPLATLADGEQLFWQVEAWDDGVRRELSPMFKIQRAGMH